MTTVVTAAKDDEDGDFVLQNDAEGQDLLVDSVMESEQNRPTLNTMLTGEAFRKTASSKTQEVVQLMSDASRSTLSGSYST